MASSHTCTRCSIPLETASGYNYPDQGHVFNDASELTRFLEVMGYARGVNIQKVTSSNYPTYSCKNCGAMLKLKRSKRKEDQSRITIIVTKQTQCTCPLITSFPATSELHQKVYDNVTTLIKEVFLALISREDNKSNPIVGIRKSAPLGWEGTEGKKQIRACNNKRYIFFQMYDGKWGSVEYVVRTKGGTAESWQLKEPVKADISCYGVDECAERSMHKPRQTNPSNRPSKTARLSNDKACQSEEMASQPEENACQASDKDEPKDPPPMNKDHPCYVQCFYCATESYRRVVFPHDTLCRCNEADRNMCFECAIENLYTRKYLPDDDLENNCDNNCLVNDGKVHPMCHFCTNPISQVKLKSDPESRWIPIKAPYGWVYNKTYFAEREYEIACRRYIIVIRPYVSHLQYLDALLTSYDLYVGEANALLEFNTPAMNRSAQKMLDIIDQYRPRVETEITMTTALLQGLSLRAYFREDKLNLQDRMPPEAAAEIAERERELEEAEFPTFEEFKKQNARWSEGKQKEAYEGNLQAFRFKLHWPNNFEIKPLGIVHEQSPRDGNEKYSDAASFSAYGARIPARTVSNNRRVAQGGSAVDEAIAVDSDGDDDYAPSD